MQSQGVSLIPTVVPDMRGGTANVTVIVSDERISSPILRAYDTAIILNQQSMDKFENTVKPGGMLLYDPNGISKHPTRKDINVYKVEGAQKAAEMGNTKIFNMIVLGAYLKVKPIVKMENVVKGIEKSLPARHHKLLPLNEEAVNQGTKIVEAVHVI